MRNIISFGIAALLTLGAIVTWATARTHSNNHAKAVIGASINPLELMKNAKELPHQPYDEFWPEFPR